MAFHSAAPRHGVAGLVLGLVLTSACGGSSNPPAPNPGPGTGGGETITGRERIGWSQQADSNAQLETFDFAIYVDGTRSVLTGETCSGSPSTFECSAPLPPMSAGQHSIELASFVIVDGADVESQKSAPLQVTVRASTAPAALVGPEDSALETSDGLRFSASVVARGLDDPTDIAIAPDGRIFVAERAGRVHIVDLSAPTHTADGAALEIESVAEPGLTAIALHPEFARSRYVYLAYAVEGRDGPAFRVARFSEGQGTLDRGAVVAREREASDHATIRFGPDGRLFVGLAAGDDPRGAQSAASLLGKILRLNEDGTTPRDNPGASPVFSSGHRDPRGLTWHPTTRVLWELDRNQDAGDELNVVVSGADYGWPLASGTATDAQSVGASLVLPAGTDVSGASFVPLKSGSPIAGELLIASRGAEDLLRIRPGSTNSAARLVEGMLQGRYGRISSVQVSSDGSIYLTTANRDTWGIGRDVLVRISADRTTPNF